MTARNEDFLFAQEALTLGYVSDAQIEEGFLLQRRMAEDLQIDERLAIILVKRGWLAEEQARRVYGIIEPEGSGAQIEGYRLVEKIGRGAMGTVYKAIHEGLHRVVAIKILRRDLATDKTQIERLKREAKLLADLDHPNIVRAFDAGESNGYPYLVMEYVEGETLRDRITRDGALSNEKALRITRSLADALEKARRMGIVHRDVKPGNILLSKSGVPKLMDLGLAKGPIDMGLTQHGATVGTPQFISPEQAQDPRKADTRSDIYSLGATLYAMMTTRPPFEGATLAEIITKVLYSQPTPPRVRNPDVSPEVAHLIERMMLKDPSLRYQTPAQVVADIDMIRGGQSIVPKGFRGNWEAFLLRQRQRLWVRRGAIGFVAAAILAVGVVLFLNKRARDEAQVEVDALARQVLELPLVGTEDEVPAIGDLRERTKDLREQILMRKRDAGVHCARMAEVDERLRYYEGNYGALYKFAGGRDHVAALRRNGNYTKALEFLGGLKASLTGYPVALRRCDELIATTRKASDAGWKARQAAVLAGTARDLGEFVALWQDYARALDGNYDPGEAYRQARRDADALRIAAQRILGEVARVEQAFSPEAVEDRIAGLAFYDLKTELDDRIRGALTAVEGHWEAFRLSDAVNVPKARLIGENGYVQRALGRVEYGLDSRIEAAWQALRALVPTLDADAAIRRLRDFEVATGRGNFRSLLELSGRVADLRTTMNAEHLQQEKQAQAAYAATRDAVLAALRAGDAQALREAVGYALQHRPLSAEGRSEVGDLAAAAARLDSLYASAIAYLQALEKAGQPLTNVRLRGADGAVVTEKRMTDVRVDAAKNRFSARVQRRGSPRQQVTVELPDVDLRQLQAWANLGPAGVPDAFLRGLIKLALLPPVRDAPGEDLRELRTQYAPLLDAFAEADEAKPWAGIVRGLLAELDGYQAQREALARGLVERINLSRSRDKPLVLNMLFDQVSDRKGRARYTGVFDDNELEVTKANETALRQLAEQELLRLVPGSQVEELPGNRTRFVFDFDEELQLRNFEHGFGVLEPHRGAVTPFGHPPQRLHLLKGVSGLLRDRPLSMYSMFDPHERIVVELSLETLRGSFLVAFDIDGVQLAVCSADPNYWKWRLDPDAPLLEEEKAPPEFDYYGRGRGIAFHEGTHFGESFPEGGNWDWPSIGRGRHFERWQEKAYLDKRRDRLFAFEPGRRYAVKIVRHRDQMQFWVDGELIEQRRKDSWAQKGATSDIDPKVRHGSGRIQILTWTPMAIDDLRLEGRVMDRWRRLQKQRLRDESEESKEGGRGSARDDR